MSFHLAILSGFGGFTSPTAAGLAGVLKRTVKSRVPAVGEFQNLGVLQCCQPFYASHISISTDSTLLIKPHHFVESSWNVMAHGDAREGKWRGNGRMEWVASTLHTTSEHGVSSIRVQLKRDGTWWCMGGEVKGKWANGVGSQYPSHYLGTWCIQH